MQNLETWRFPNFTLKYIKMYAKFGDLEISQFYNKIHLKCTQNLKISQFYIKNVCKILRFGDFPLLSDILYIGFNLTI